eukprot:g1844.t1
MASQNILKRTVYVGGLDEQVDRKVLEEAFVRFGELKTVEIPLDLKTGKHRGFGFVEFMELDDAQDAIDNMHHAELYGRVIKTISSAEDLMLASQMLGSCREMDFLDRETWGLLSLDLDVNLLRVGVTDPPLPSSGARPPEMSRSFRAWRGMAEDLPSEYQNARQNLWHALSLSSHFRRAVEKKVALGFATGALTSYANSPRPVVRGRPVEVALFAMPVWYVTEFVAGLLLWRFPALAMQIWAAPLGGYNLPRSHELRPLVEPFLLEAPELRPLELIDGYCCDWQRVTFEVVRGALKQLATRLKTSSVLVCGGLLGQEKELILDRRQPYSGSHDGCGESTAVRVTAPWVLELCGWRRHAYFMEWSSFYRYPYFFHFESIGHLLQLVNSMTLPELWALSVRMRKLNARLRAEEVKFWGDLILALAL